MSLEEGLGFTAGEEELSDGGVLLQQLRDIVDFDCFEGAVEGVFSAATLDHIPEPDFGFFEKPDLLVAGVDRIAGDLRKDRPELVARMGVVEGFLERVDTGKSPKYQNLRIVEDDGIKWMVQLIHADILTRCKSSIFNFQSSIIHLPTYPLHTLIHLHALRIF